MERSPIFISAMGTTGTIMGVSRYLERAKQKYSNCRHTTYRWIEHFRAFEDGHQNFYQKYLKEIELIRIIDVSEAEAKAMTRRLAKEEGILAGMSSGGALTAALKIASEIKSGVIVFIVCDRGDRYLSSNLFG